METKRDHLYTPQLVGIPKKSSKVNQKPFQHRLEDRKDFSSTNLSLDLVPQLESDSRPSDASVRLQKQRELARNCLKRTTPASRTCDAASMFKTPAREESTVNESDLMKLSGISGFGARSLVPSSTPRSSVRDSLDVNARMSAEESRRQSQTFDALIHKLKTSDISISEVCKEFREKMGVGSSTNFEELDSNSFLPAEIAVEKLKADELSWRNEKDIPVDPVSYLSEFSEASLQNKVSMGEFFQQRSEDITNLIPNRSPEKRQDPVALVDSFTSTQTIPEQGSRESLSISKIAKLLSELDEKESPSRMISYLLNQNKENVSPQTETFSKSLLLSPNTSKSSGISRNRSPNRESDISPRMRHDKSLSSLRSGSALSSLPDGKLPLETTRRQLIWGCVKLGKSSTQEFVLRNRSQHRLRVQIATDMMEFKILKDRNEGDAVTVAKMLIRPFESRTVSVVFCPSAPKAFAGKLRFMPIDLQQSKEQMIPMYGYGGHALVDFCTSIMKDPSGKFLLSLGDLTNKTTITKTVLCRNTGLLPGFVCAFFEPKSMCSFDSVSITPNKFIVKPKQELLMHVTYTATKEDIKYFYKATVTDVLEIGIIKLYTGAEALRGRLRRLMDQVSRQKLGVKSIVQELVTGFTNEDIPGDVMELKDGVNGMKELMQQICMKEVIVTIEHDPEATIVPIDDTSIFQSLFQDLTVSEID